MPIYEYKCEQGHTFEVMQRMSDDPLLACQTCQAPVQRVFHPVAVHFKGSGFYNTDYGTRKRQREKGETSDTSSDSSSTAGSDAKTGAETKTGSEAKTGSGGKPDAKPASSSSSSAGD